MTDKKICIVGLGYVGLPLAVAFAKEFKVVGFDISRSRIEELKGGYDKTSEVEGEALRRVNDNLNLTSNIKDAEKCNIYIVTVPTPIDSSNLPDLNPLIQSSRSVGSILGNGDIVIYESTVYPGVTEDICVPELEKSSNLKFNKDFFCGYSPERINPGDKEHTVEKILKVTSGSTPEIALEIDDLYKQVITAGTFKASSIKVAEASKVIENTQRDVNIALINEFALIFDQMNVDTQEVLDAAATKWNFIKLRPGLVGGHCIGIDPYYLTFKAEEMGYRPDLILTAREINNGMSKYIADKTIQEMCNAEKKIKGSKILVLGVTFKEDCSDMRNTKVIDIIQELSLQGANIVIHDPWVDFKSGHEDSQLKYVDSPLESDEQYDAIIVAVGHKQFKAYTDNDFDRLSKGQKVIIDIKSIVNTPTWRL